MLIRILNKTKFNIKTIIFNTIKGLCILFIFVYIISYLFMDLMNLNMRIGSYKYADYDIVLRGLSIKTLEDMKKECPYIKNTFPVYQGSIEIVKGAKILDTSVFNVPDNYFKEVYTLIPTEQFISLNKKLLNPKYSPILISADNASSLNIKTNDKINLKNNKGTKEYTVAGIYDSCFMTFASMITILDDDIDSDLLVHYEYYTLTFIKLSDYDKGIKYLTEKHYNEFSFSQTKSIPTDMNEIEKLKQKHKYNSYEIRKVQLSRTYDELYSIYRFNKYRYAYITIMPLYALLAICIYDSYKHSKENEAKCAILRASGLSKLKLFTFYLIRSALFQSILLALSLLIMKTFAFNDKYLSRILFIKWSGILFTVVLFSSVLSAIAALIRLRDNVLIIKLKDENDD